MFGLDDMFGNMDAKQEAMREKLASIMVETEVADGKIKISANANRQLNNISIDPEWLKTVDHEELEDLLLVGINRVLEDAHEKEAEESEKLFKDMLPPGLDGFFK